MDTTRNNDPQQHDSTQHYVVLVELADCHASLGNYGQAQKFYEKAAVLSPDEAAPYVGLGVVALQQDNLEDAMTAFRIACRLKPDCSKAYSGLGMVYQQQEDYQQAFDMFLKCLELDADNLIGILGLFQTSCRMGSFEKVTHYLEMYLQMHPGDMSVMYPLAALYAKDGRFAESRKVLLDILALDDNHRDAIGLLEEVEHNLAGARKTEVAIK